MTTEPENPTTNDMGKNPPEKDPMTPEEISKYDECMDVISRAAMKMYIGSAMRLIRTEKLWRGSHASYEEFLGEVATIFEEY